MGSETFKFLSAPEPGDLCDIYEEKSCESGGNFLVEAGSVWRKLSVLRILSATEKDRVKQRTTEAEKKQKLRKYSQSFPLVHTSWCAFRFRIYMHMGCLYVDLF